ncbi:MULTISPECIES: NAD(P)/FAD-dependent oxidoreductase [unclassified Wenzhouxiangella]|uniref:NAD(P)/FAD-dependent oxidoreductase n=1 Tax=unclassified Wenzhouxiangella TaxID=2613841 RepID=UPI000E32BC27|nr:MULTISPECIES: NAD(P)/FAD-dependent oxidoreductase [unclassified Wenzhouxiangella]RFF27585.1 NAD(P)/FAD-dependent oxidoreductase [Wenzhouxiangella sp. 15181]RFP70109.1 NAD(P)/FAD-dependent oxidoreductase [Wenzhouxiangella sp. 15190]
MAVSSERFEHADVVIIGAGAAGLMCAITAARRGRSVLVVDHANKIGKKILMSGGGRCNFTNMYSSPDNFLSANPHFCKSALSRYTPWDFIALVEAHGVPYHEKKLGQLFCDRSSKDIVRLLLDECEAAGVEVRTHSPVTVEQLGPPHELTGPNGPIRCESLVIATGGYSIPRMGASGFGFDFARQLGLNIQPTRAALVPFVFEGRKLEQIQGLAGISIETYSEAGGTGFRENILFTHRGLSGPAMLQTSSYWHPGEPVTIDLLPDTDLEAHLREWRGKHPRSSFKNALADLLPRRIAERWCELWLKDKPMAEVSDAEIEQAVRRLQPWSVWPAGTEGYRTAEVTIGGVDTAALSSKTMACREQPGVYFIGEVVDVTGHLGGHNFQWAWASGHAAGESV